MELSNLNNMCGVCEYVDPNVIVDAINLYLSQFSPLDIVLYGAAYVTFVMTLFPCIAYYITGMILVLSYLDLFMIYYNKYVIQPEFMNKEATIYHGVIIGLCLLYLINRGRKCFS